MSKRSRHARIEARRPLGAAIPNRRALAELVGPSVYYVRTSDDLVKIGWTENLGIRVGQLGGWSRLLIFHAGTHDDEQQLHARLAEHAARGREYYRPADAVLDHIDTLRATAGLPPVERWAVRTSPVA